MGSNEETFEWGGVYRVLRNSTKDDTHLSLSRYTDNSSNQISLGKKRKRNSTYEAAILMKPTHIYLYGLLINVYCIMTDLAGYNRFLFLEMTD